jgi:ferredoxin-thioredoxin reductase catalytic subunit
MNRVVLVCPCPPQLEQPQKLRNVYCLQFFQNTEDTKFNTIQAVSAKIELDSITHLFLN